VRRTLVALALILSITGCGGGDVSDANGSTTAPAAATSTTVRPPALLSEEALAAALLDLQDLPPGYSQEPPSSQTGKSKTFCDYEPPFEEEIRVRRDFVKGAGLSAEYLSVGLRQYAGVEQASAAFEALTDALSWCTGETYEGSNLTYAPMSAPKVGAGSVGIKMTSDDGPDLLQFFAVVGPVLVNTGGGGLVNANVNEVMHLLEAQVDKYETAVSP
jgi:hypothetical protein